MLHMPSVQTHPGFEKQQVSIGLSTPEMRAAEFETQNDNEDMYGQTQGCSCTECRNDGKPHNKASRDVALIRFRQVRYTRILNPKVETLSGCNITLVCAHACA